LIEIDNRTDLRFDTDIIGKIYEIFTTKDMELIVVDSETMRSINREHRGIDAPTDVLSFPLNSAPNAPLGSIVICADKVKEAAKRYGHSISDETALLFLHGILHLLGYDHESDEGEMRKMEKETIERLGLPKSLIIRSEKE